MLIRNAVFRWVGLIAEVGAGLVTTPLLINHLGQAAYGVWLVVVSTTGIFGFLDLGLASAVTTRLAAEFARGQKEAAWSTAATALTLYLAIAAGVGICYLGLAYWGASLFNWGPEFLALGTALFLVMGLCVAASFFNNLFEGIVIASERQHMVGLVEACVAMARLAALVLVVKLGGGLLAVAVAHTLVTVGGYGANFLYGKRCLGLTGSVRPGWDGGLARSLLAYGRSSLLISLGMRMRQDGPVLLTGSLAGPLQVPFLGVGMRLLGYLNNLVQLAAGVAQPRFAALEGAHKREQTEELLLRSSLYASLLTAFMVLGAAFLAGPFLRLWLGPHFEPAVVVIWLLLGPLGLYMALRPCEVLLYGIGRHRINGLIYLAETLVMAGLCLLAIDRWGVRGAALSLGAALLILRPWLLPAYACRQIGLRLGVFWRRGPLRAALAGFLAALPLAALFRFWSVQSWVELAGACLALPLVCAPVFWLVGLDAGERGFWRERLSDMAASRRSRQEPGRPPAD